MKGSYYDEHAKEFAEQTAHLDASFLYGPFLKHVPAGGRILDAGCGTGRDAKQFLNMGYDVTAVDASPAMVAMASELTGRDAVLMSFQELEFEEEFDGIWACASLLHVPKTDIDAVLDRLSRALKPQGVMYLSFKYGTGENVRKGRLFNDYTDEGLAELLSRHHELSVIEIWNSKDIREKRTGEVWVNGLVGKFSVEAGK